MKDELELWKTKGVKKSFIRSEKLLNIRGIKQEKKFPKKPLKIVKIDKKKSQKGLCRLKNELD